MSRYWCERALVGDPAAGEVAEAVLVETAGAGIASVASDTRFPPEAVRLGGLVVPGLANAHCHAFHRALRGRTHEGAGDFWTWRDEMYRLASSLDPEGYRELARATYAEMVLAGITVVGEFHYLHHGAGGRRYADPNSMGQALLAAAAEAGVRLTLLDTCYLQGDVDGSPLAGVQVRFGDGDADAWAARVTELRTGPESRLGAAVHSVRAVPPAQIEAVAGLAGDRSWPLHFHLSEQRAENDRCLAVLGRTPARVLGDAGALGRPSTAVHATHLTPDDISLLGQTGTAVCMCPTTERDLADGIGPAHALAGAGSPLCLGSDSQAVTDLWEEARAVELDERLATERRGHHRPADLLAAATIGGARALGWPDAGRIAAGATADLVAVSLDTPRLAGIPRERLVAGLVFGATAADVTDVVIGGQPVVAGGRHLRMDDVPRALTESIGGCWEVAAQVQG